MSDDPATRRPGTVTAAAVILFGCAGIPLVLGVIALTPVNVDIYDEEVAAAVLLMAFALVTIALATRILRGSDGARTTVVVLLSVSAALQVLADTDDRTMIVGVGLNLLVIGLLAWNRGAQDYFDRHRDPATNDRPGIVTAAAVILYVWAGVTLFTQLLFPVITTGGLRRFGTLAEGAAMIIGLALLALATGVLRGSNLARVATIVVLGVGIAANAIYWTESSPVDIGLHMLVIVLMLCAPAYFRGSRSRWWVTSSPGGPGS